jgi:hypothetical protein
MPTKSAKLQHIYYPAKNDTQEQAKFPTSRYFQIHFEYLESQLVETRRSIEAMQAQLAELTLRISLIAPDLTETKYDK